MLDDGVSGGVSSLLCTRGRVSGRGRANDVASAGGVVGRCRLSRGIALSLAGSGPECGGNQILGSDGECWRRGGWSRLRAMREQRDVAGYKRRQ